MTEAIREFAAHVGTVGQNVIGHSMRTTGAQRMAAAGVPDAKISMFGRWASRQMLNYARESLLVAESLELAANVASTLTNALAHLGGAAYQHCRKVT